MSTDASDCSSPSKHFPSPGKLLIAKFMQKTCGSINHLPGRKKKAEKEKEKKKRKKRTHTKKDARTVRKPKETNALSSWCITQYIWERERERERERESDYADTNNDVSYLSTRASSPRHGTAEFRRWGCFYLLSAAPLPPMMMWGLMSSDVYKQRDNDLEQVRCWAHQTPPLSRPTWYPRSATRQLSTRVDRVGSGV